ncbi:spore germination protein [Evansella sp. AB-rgal1]|uniref:spore germination protein n=1 Tax=Evansella sp. AB-rgal1 TaxID=3242696 RepID=UPI00359D3B1B
MFFGKKKKKRFLSKRMVKENETITPTKESVIKAFSGSEDLQRYFYQSNGVEVFYFPSLVDEVKLDEQVLTIVGKKNAEDIPTWLKSLQTTEALDGNQIVQDILKGSVAIFLENKVYTYNVFGPEFRTIEKSELESVIVGSHDAFVENVNTNLSLIRRSIKTPNLKVVKVQVGEITKTEVLILYIDGIAKMEIVNQLKKRIQLIEIDGVLDVNEMAQLIDDSPNSLFPQFHVSELPSDAISKLLSGKIAVLMEGSPSALTAPADFFEFIRSPEDYNQRWIVASSLRLLRVLAILITLTFTAIYVSVLTFHYEMIPEDLLITIAESRNRVPFTPIVEALLLELLIELLREAGARLPTKVGQTIGIVGGIVIGQAIVAAGLTSNILIIVVASSAIASFALPSYTMSNSIRIVRFSMIIAAGFLGFFGMVISMAFIIVHITSLSSLRTPYLIPIAPLYLQDWKDTLIRGPLFSLKKRPVANQTYNKTRVRMRK